jgi:hypothetical protein
VAAPLDIILLTHNRLAHLVATVDALEARTTSPYRLTVVDNASGPEVRNWLAANRKRFHQVILRAENTFLRALNDGIAATTSDPFMVTDPDLIVPEQSPCWLTTMRDVLDRHPDFGVLGIGLDQSNLPSVQAPESIDPSEIVDGEIVARPVGSVFQMIRRDALKAPYVTDYETCLSAARAGYRYGWALKVRAHHLGWDDFTLYPSHLAGKLIHGEYREVQLIERAPTLAELAVAGPVVEVTRALGVPDASVLELAWSAPSVAASVTAAFGLLDPDPAAALPFDAGAAGAVAIVGPPEGAPAAALVREACRVATHAVVAVAPLSAFDGATAAELAPAGWTGREADGPGDVTVALARWATEDPALAAQVGVGTLEHREQWLALFAAGAFGPGARRLWIWECDAPAATAPAQVLHDPARVRPWIPVAVAPTPPKRSLRERLRGRAEREGRLLRERLRILRTRPSASER